MELEAQSSDIIQSLSSPIGDNLTKMGIVQLTSIQQKCFEPASSGADIVAQSQTGSGKTLAFVMPMMNKILSQTVGQDLQGLVLVPTRELATQVAAVITKLTAGTKIRVATVIGGDSYARQLSALRMGAQIVVGTPGRVADLEKRKAISFKKLSFFVLDEVDQMLDIGFADDIEALHKLIPHKVQTLFFSATLSPRIRTLANKMVQDPVQVQVTSTAEPLKIEHKFFCVQDGSAIHALVNALSYEEPEQALIFCETKAECDQVSHLLTSYGLATAALHSDLSQSQRTQTLDRFRSKVLRYLVATNVAARGIDIKELPLVVNIAVPFQTESYVHRTGRTGRAGASGLAWTFVSARRLRAFRSLLKEAKINATEEKIPTPVDIKQRRLDRKLKEILEAAPVKIDANIEHDVEKMVAGLNSEQLIGALKNVLLRNVSEVRAFEVKGFSEQPKAQRFTSSREGANASASAPSFDKKRSFGGGERGRFGGNRGGYGENRSSGGYSDKRSAGGGSGYVAGASTAGSADKRNVAAASSSTGSGYGAPRGERFEKRSEWKPDSGRDGKKNQAEKSTFSTEKKTYPPKKDGYAKSRNKFKKN